MARILSGDAAEQVSTITWRGWSRMRTIDWSHLPCCLFPRQVSGGLHFYRMGPLSCQKITPILTSSCFTIHPFSLEQGPFECALSAYFCMVIPPSASGLFSMLFRFSPLQTTDLSVALFFSSCMRSVTRYNSLSALAGASRCRRAEYIIRLLGTTTTCIL